MSKVLIEVNEKKGTFEGRTYHNYQLFVRDMNRPKRDQIIRKNVKAKVLEDMDIDPFDAIGSEVSWYCDDYGNIAQFSIE